MNDSQTTGALRDYRKKEVKEWRRNEKKVRGSAGKKEVVAGKSRSGWGT